MINGVYSKLTNKSSLATIKLWVTSTLNVNGGDLDLIASFLVISEKKRNQ